MFQNALTVDIYYDSQNEALAFMDRFNDQSDDFAKNFIKMLFPHIGFDVITCIARQKDDHELLSVIVEVLVESVEPPPPSIEL